MTFISLPATALLIYISINLWLYWSVFCHEMGHFIFAKISGIKPYRVKVGSGPQLFRGRWFDAIFELRLFPSGGVTYTAYSHLEGLKTKLILFFIGGCSVNFLFLTILVSLYFTTRQFFILIFIGIELILLVSNLTPRTLKIDGRAYTSDGKNILSALKTDYEQVFKMLFAAYQKSLLRYEHQDNIAAKKFLNNDLELLMKLSQAEAELSLGHFDEAVPLFLEILQDAKLSSPEKAFILDYLSCVVVIHGCKRYLKEAEKWSAEAIRLASSSKTLQGTRGAVLIEAGRYAEGKQLLLPLTTPENEALDQAISSCYLAKAEYFLGNESNVKDWLLKAKATGVAGHTLERIETELSDFVTKSQS
ncbi:MAG: site-2 protease family protein [Scytolyngbya sp. HA4215-MV1]|jgi:hypothetical protein|nr:site-2 protease family protein [Scytolyngbya sp. HA4215-MV1]